MLSSSDRIIVIIICIWSYLNMFEVYLYMHEKCALSCYITLYVVSYYSRSTDHELYSNQTVCIEAKNLRYVRNRQSSFLRRLCYNKIKSAREKQ